MLTRTKITSPAFYLTLYKHASVHSIILFQLCTRMCPMQTVYNGVLKRPLQTMYNRVLNRAR